MHCQPGWYIWSTFPYNSHTKLSYITCALNPHESELSWRSFSMNCVLYTKFVCGFFFLLNSLILFFALILLRFSHICRTWSVFWNFISAPHSNTKAPIHSQFLLFLCMCWHVCVFFWCCCCCWALSACTSSFRSIERFKPKLQLQSVLSVWHGAHFGTHQLQIVSELLQWKWIQTICYARKMIQQILKVEQRQCRSLANRNCKWIELKSGIFCCCCVALYLFFILWMCGRL